MRRRLEDAAANAATLTGPDLDRLEEDLHVTLLGYCANGTIMQAISLPQALLIAHRFLYRWMPNLFGAEPFLPEHTHIIERLETGHVAEAAQRSEEQTSELQSLMRKPHAVFCLKKKI